MALNGNSQAGKVHWIDHWVVCTEDVDRWTAFHTKVLGAEIEPDPKGAMTGIGAFILWGCSRTGGFHNKALMPPTLGLGKGLPRYGMYIEKEAIDRHRRRLEAAGANHSDPIRTSEGGDPGTAIRWQDPDGNQFEFWAPDVLPDGAMARAAGERVGRISHAVLESRDLDRTAEFFHRYCGLEPLRNADVAQDTLVLPLVAGAKLIFKKVETFGGRTTGCGLRDTHTALTVHKDEYISNYKHMWAELPEWDYDPMERTPIANPGALPARTVMHPTPAGIRLKKMLGRGDDFLDFDTNMFHFYGGGPVDGNSLAVYSGFTTNDYLATFEKDANSIGAAPAIV